MKRREFVRLLTLTTPAVLSSCAAIRHICSSCVSPFESPKKINTDVGDMAETQTIATTKPTQLSESDLHQEGVKSVYFDQDFPDDVFFVGAKFEMVKRMAFKFHQVQNYVGQGNFNLLGIDEFLRYTEMAPGITPLSREEKLFLEEIFYFDAAKYGFTGDKVFSRLTDNLRKNETIKIPYSGHYLRKGESLKLYQKVKEDVGDTLILTSGVRAIAKQFHLFLVKAIETKGNMSKASRSLAPPGYSFHGRGDFDVGKVGHGLRNFTDDFASTDEYKRLIDLGYVNIRYTESNTLGVRFEPWHIKVHS